MGQNPQHLASDGDVALMCPQLCPRLTAGLIGGYNSNYLQLSSHEVLAFLFNIPCFLGKGNPKHLLLCSPSGSGVAWGALPRSCSKGSRSAWQSLLVCN